MGDAVRVVAAQDADAAINDPALQGYRVARIDCRTADGLIADLAKALHWQDHLGFTPAGLNLDALYDALHHEPSAERPRLALIFEGYDALTARDPRRAAQLPEVIEQRAAELAAQGPRRLTALLVPTAIPAKV